MKYPRNLLKLIGYLRKFPGVGTRSAERYAFNMLGWKEEQLSDFGKFIAELKDKLICCESCGALFDSGEVCQYCSDTFRNKNMICVVATSRDIFSLEETRDYKGLYHVLGGVLSPLEGKTPDVLRFSELKERVVNNGVGEIIIALDSTLEGDTTALYIKKIFSDSDVAISRLAFGIPMGSSLEYVDGGTLSRALVGRRDF